ncbi:glycoside hydrolase family 18 protein [Hymenobacter ruricola]|uniref:chitinase n=1 Tax=Hymenobacter ruricola TaxID=2791023 RepID=A0ABS0I701_9BACT|nr:glycoside hydrolase family 18 protein [Hymenobacter ruricola]MBF9222682.1 hypothetical protein [Hymenobacter ruricola]
MNFLLPTRLLAWALLLPLWAQAQGQPSIHSPAAYFPPDQARYKPGAPAPPAPSRLRAGMPAGSRPSTNVFGWLPAWMPLDYAQQVEFSLLTHVAYDGYQANEAGKLAPPTSGDAAKAVGLVHQANPECRVLLAVSYQEPARNAALFEPAGGPRRQALAQALAQQVKAVQADGVHLDLAFRFRAVAAEAARPAPAAPKSAGNAPALTPTERKNNQNALNQTTKTLQLTRDAFAKQKKAGKATRPKDLDAYRKAQADSAHYDDLLRGGAGNAAPKPAPALPAAGSSDTRPVAVLDLVQALRKALPATATLTLGLPAVDSAQVYGGLAALSPSVDLFVLQAFDYTTTLRTADPGPLAPLQPSTAWATQGLASSVTYYLNQRIGPKQLLVGLASLAKVWTRFDAPGKKMPPEGTPIPPRPYWYLTSRTLAAWPPTSQKSDIASGGLRLGWPAPPVADRGALVNASYLAWADDSASLAARYNWVLSQQVGGVGIWALGFDAPDAPLWGYLRTRLTQPVGGAAADTATVAAADTLAPAPVALAPADTARKPLALVQKESPLATDSTGTLLKTAQSVGHWIETSVLMRLLLLALAVLLAGAWVGMVVGAARTARYWVPFGRRRTWMLAVLLGVAALLGLYVSCVGNFAEYKIWLAWLGALAVLAGLWLAYRRARPAYLP